MIILALVLVFIPFFSIPPFVYSSYTQPFTLFVGWLAIIYAFKLRFSINILFCLSLFIGYILYLKLFVLSSSLTRGDISVLIAYIMGFLQFLLFASLFQCILNRYMGGNSTPFYRVQKALNFCIIIVSLSVPLQLITPFGKLLSYIKPRTISLSEAGFAASYRGLSGLMPEPSYVGTCLATLLFSSFLIGYLHFFVSETKTSPLVRDFSSSKSSPHFSSYSRYCSLFISSNKKQVLVALLAVFLSLSPTSLLSFVLIVSLASIPFVIQFLSGVAKYNLVKFLLIFAITGSVFIVLSNIFFAQSRLISLLKLVFSGDISRILLLDQSVADRYASSSLGVLSILNYPLGLGLNGHGYLMSDCTNQLVQSLQLMCGTFWNSNRSHNAIANLAIDGGIIFGLYVCFLLFSHARIKRFLRFTLMPTYFKYSLAIFPVSILLLFIILPAPLGSPFVWLPFSISIICLRVLPEICNKPVVTNLNMN